MAVVPVLPEDSFLLNLPFGGAVLRGLGYPKEEVEVILNDIRKKAEKDGKQMGVRRWANEQMRRRLRTCGRPDAHIYPRAYTHGPPTRTNPHSEEKGSVVDVIGEEKVVELQEKKRAADKEKDSEGEEHHEGDGYITVTKKTATSEVVAETPEMDPAPAVSMSEALASAITPDLKDAATSQNQTTTVPE